MGCVKKHKYVLRVTNTEESRSSTYQHVTQLGRLCQHLRIAPNGCSRVPGCRWRCSSLVSIEIVQINNVHIDRHNAKSVIGWAFHPTFLQSLAFDLTNHSSTVLINTLHGDYNYSTTDHDLSHLMKTSETNWSHTTELYSVPKFFHCQKWK